MICKRGGPFILQIGMLADRGQIAQVVQNLVINVKGTEFQIGLFLNSFIEMLIILGILYFLVGFLLKRDDLLLKGKRPK